MNVNIKNNKTSSKSRNTVKYYKDELVFLVILTIILVDLRLQWHPCQISEVFFCDTDHLLARFTALIMITKTMGTRRNRK